MSEPKIMVLSSASSVKDSLMTQYLASLEGGYELGVDYNSYHRAIEIEGHTRQVEIMPDLERVFAHDPIRELLMKNAEGLVLVYSVSDQDSLDKLQGLHDEILRAKGSASIPSVVVGIKSDQGQASTISQEQVKALVAKLGCAIAVEATLGDKDSVDAIFVETLRLMAEHAAAQAQSAEGSSHCLVC